MTGLPMLEVIGDTTSKLAHGVTLGHICERHRYASATVCGSYILMCDIESLSTWVVAAMVIQILGSFGMHKISNG